MDDSEVSLKLFVTLSKAYRTIMEKAQRDMKSHGLSAHEFMILEALYHKGGIPIQEIGGKLLVTSGSMTYNVDKLEARGLLRRQISAADRRVIFTHLTAEGRALFDEIFPKHAAVIQRLTAGLTREEKQQMVPLLKKLGMGAR